MLNRLIHLLGLWLIGLSLALAQPGAPAVPGAQPPQAAEAPVVFGGEVLFRIATRVGSFSPADRARAINARLANLSRGPLVPGKLSVVAGDSASDIVAGDVVILSVTDADARAAGQSRDQLASLYANAIAVALRESRQEYGFQSIALEVLLAALATAILYLLFRLSRAAFGRVHARLDTWRETRIRAIRIQRMELISAGRIHTLLMQGVRALRLAVSLVVFYAYILLVLALFPWTRGASASLTEYLRSGVSLVLGAVASNLPNLVMIALIAVITRYVIKFCGFVFREIERASITISGFYPEWAGPTYKIARFLILAFAAVVVFPYLPGHDSPAFRGVSIFVGVLFSLGSAGAVGNIVAGVLLTYTRAFQIGDRVKIADTTGDVLEKTLLVTRIRTIKNEDITVPNSLVLGSHIVNFTSCATGDGLILHTAVTIGYDAPWRDVHRLLIRAALATEGILPTPAPFVLQTGLNDFYVSYEINAYTSQPASMAVIYAEIHQNIQDTFNEAGMEICSPHFAAVRDANHIAIPSRYVSEKYSPPAFRVRVENADQPRDVPASA